MPDSQPSKSAEESSDSGASEQDGSQGKIINIGTELVRSGLRSTIGVALMDLKFKLGLDKAYDVRVHRFGNTIVKWPSRTRAAEAFAMEFVRRNTRIPVPRVFQILKKGKQTYIFMEYVDGTMLADVWPDMTMEQKTAIVARLKEYFKELRALNSPRPGRVEAADGTPCYDSRLGGEVGPFDNIEAFHEHLGHDYIRDSAEKYPSYQEAFARVAGKQYRTAFSHGDLALHNILVRDNEIVAIIDWEFAGWYPEYWEYTQGIESNYNYPEFKEMFQKGDVIEPYPEELETEKLLASVFTRLA